DLEIAAVAAPRFFAFLFPCSKSGCKGKKLILLSAKEFEKFISNPSQPLNLSPRSLQTGRKCS
ncbi:MAG: hypothetical protein VYB44_13615, partial [Bacteroidota bacterium]|nr:hypothetical protein [Bacteroidota bacterium]